MNLVLFHGKYFAVETRFMDDVITMDMYVLANGSKCGKIIFTKQEVADFLLVFNL